MHAFACNKKRTREINANDHTVVSVLTTTLCHDVEAKTIASGKKIEEVRPRRAQ